MVGIGTGGLWEHLRVRHVYECPVRWADLDLLGHVNNVAYVDFLQEARADLFRSHRSGLRAPELEEGLVVVSTQVRYRESMLLRFEPVRVEVWVVEVRAASFTLAYEVFDERPDGTRAVYCTATTVMAPYVFAEERPRRLTAEEKQALERHRDEGAAPEPRPWAPPHRTEVGHYPVHVRFSDVDVYGHVNNVTYVEYFQEARIAVLARLWGEVPAGSGRTSVVVAQAEIDHLVPMLHRPEPYDAFTQVVHVGNTSVVVETEVVDRCGPNEVRHARARVVLVFVDDDGRPRRPEESVRAPLVAEVAPA